MRTTIPTDVFLDILQQLRQDCRNPHDANTILRLAFTSRHLRNVIDSWAGTATDVKHDLEILSTLDTDTPPPSALSVLCRRIGGMCVFCSNRARHSREIFTDLQVCQACEARKLAKISGVNLNRLYVPSMRVTDFLENVEQPDFTTIERRNNLDHCLYRWSDIKPLVESGFFKKRSGLGYMNKQIPVNLEEFAEFGFPLLNVQGQGWLSMKDEVPGSVLRESFKSWYDDTIDKESPLQVELALFNEFLYRFDYSWEPKSTFQERLAEYAYVARHRAHIELWPGRPWRLAGFPKLPRCSISNPYSGASEKGADSEAFSQHEMKCKVLRSFIRIMPWILSKPSIWSTCVNDKRFGLGSTWGMNLVTSCYDTEIELLTNVRGDDVFFVRSGSALKPVIYRRETERQNITRKKVAILSIGKDTVEIKLPGPNAAVVLTHTR